MSASSTTQTLTSEEERDNRLRQAQIDHIDALHDQQMTHHLTRIAETERITDKQHTRKLRHAQLDHEQKLRQQGEIHGQQQWQAQDKHEQTMRHMEEIHKEEQAHARRMWIINHPKQNGASS